MDTQWVIQPHSVTFVISGAHCLVAGVRTDISDFRTTRLKAWFNIDTTWFLLLQMLKNSHRWQHSPGNGTVYNQQSKRTSRSLTRLHSSSMNWKVSKVLCENFSSALTRSADHLSSFSVSRLWSFLSALWTRRVFIWYYHNRVSR